MRKAILLLLISFLCLEQMDAQMLVNGTTKYGNEWIDQSKRYFEIKLAENGIYQIDFAQLTAAGIPIENIQGAQIQLFYMGEEVPIITSTATQFKSGDFIEFFGQKNRGKLDSHLYKDPSLRQLNPEYSLFSDTSSYYLSWDPSLNNRRMTKLNNDLSQELPPPENFYMHEEKQVFDSFHHKPTHNGTDRVRYSSFDFAEGYGSSLEVENKVDFETSHVFSNGNSPKINVRFGANSGGHVFEVYLDGTFQSTEGWFGYGILEKEYNFSTDRLKDNMSFEIIGTSNNENKKDKNIIAFANLIYPRTYNFGGAASYNFPLSNSVFQRYFEISEFDLEGGAVALYDVRNGNFLDPVISDAKVKFILPPSNSKRDLVLINKTKAIKSINSIEEIEIVDYSNVDPSYIILTSRKLNSNQSGQNYVQAYADYRSSEVGGAHNVAIVEVENLYDQFGYGVERHSISIRNFLHYITQQWTNAEYLFIIGKALEYPLIRSTEQLTDQNFNKFHVPTFGNPGGDVLLASENGEVFPLMALGRYAAQTADDVRLYLEKVIEHDNPLSNEQTIEDQLWKKKIIHLSGGDATIQEIIKNFLGEMEGVIENNIYGAEVTTYQKQTADLIQTSLSQQIINQINEGVSIITFFGHSAVGTFDFSLEDPAKYKNFGKYPLIISLGCHSGNIHTNTFGLSEDFVIEDGRAAIAFLASSSSAYISPQRDSGKDLYGFLGGDYYGESIGKIIRESVFKRKDNLAISVRTLMEQLTFHGDPAIRLHPATGPDYVVDYSSIQTDPKIVSTNLENFEVSFDVVNLGRVEEDSITIELMHQLPDGSFTDTLYHKIKAPSFVSKNKISLPVPGVKSRGKNTLYITADVHNDIAERPEPAAEENNETISGDGEKGFCFFILDNSARAIYPTEFAIVNEADINLVASTSNAFVTEQKYIIEIDTTEFFNSPLKKRTEIIQGGGIVEWNPNLSFENAAVYYWRISPDSTNANIGYVWNESSFIYLPSSSPGWNQSHYFQYLKDDFDRMTINEENRNFEFTKKTWDIRIKNQFLDLQDWWIFVNGTAWSSLNPRNLTPFLGVFVFNPETIIFFNNGTDFGSLQHSRDLFPYKMNKIEDRQNIKELLDAVPNGSKVFITTYLRDANSDLHVDKWAADSISLGYNLFSVLESYGATKVRMLEERGTVPYTFIFEKGVGPSFEDISFTIEEHLDISSTAQTFWESGSTESKIIGPATAWHKILWSEKALNPADKSSLVIYGIKSNGERDSIISLTNTYDLDLDFIDPQVYSQLLIKFKNEDDDRRTASQINYWRVLYDGLPDAAFDFSEYFVFHQDTIDRGDVFRFGSGIRNTTAVPMDSLLVKYTLKDQFNTTQLFFDRVAPLEAKGKIQINFDLNTQNLSGEYEFSVEINPGKDQPELFDFNNFALTRFVIREDKINPILDVTFDGIHIMDGDIVSPKPNILASLTDENLNLLVDDIEAFEVALEYPDGNLWNIPLDHPSLTFMPAVGPENIAKLSFNPTLDQEGDYKLIIQAKDKAQNFSGNNAYEVGFRVVMGQRISNVLNYPNPFSTSTQFVFTLTGEQIPEYFKIQIMTLSGKVVKEISKEEIGFLHIGVNKSKYRWDGTDDFGDRLANGIYLYRVIAKDQDQQLIESFDTSVDNLFKKGFGKMVLMR